jgi:hypothetical protein
MLKSDDIITHPSDPRIAAFATFWEEARGGRTLPYKAAFDALTLRRWLGHVLIMDVIDNGKDFRYRLVGTAIAAALDRDLTGKRVSQCRYDDPENVFASFRLPVELRRPTFRAGPVVWNNDRRFRSYESVHCPVTEDGDSVSHTIGVQVYS